MPSGILARAGHSDRLQTNLKKNPDIKINIQVVDWDNYWTMLEAGATGGSLPDTFWMHSNEIYRYGSNEMLLPLDDYLAKSKEAKLENFPDGLNEIYNIKGKQFAVPKFLIPSVSGYNKKMFDEAEFLIRMILGIGTN